MATLTTLVFLSLSVLVMLSFVSTHSSTYYNSGCDTTSYPEYCKYYTSLKTKHSQVDQKFDLSNVHVVVRMALDEAIHTQNVIAWRIKDGLQNEIEMEALSDCSEFFVNTISRLNLVKKNPNSAFSDKQTWLSMALANVKTCTRGFKELGLLDHPIHFLANNVSKLLSNAISINHDIAGDLKPEYKAVVPEWTSSAYNTVLGVFAADLKVRFVVAQDGSGNATTIREAINAASMRKGTERFVIYVKAGTYQENIEIRENMNNIVLFGDGIGKTIITGNKHAMKGVPTAQTATFGIRGDGFIARDITFRNTAGPTAGQAVAVRSQSDFSVYYKCSFEGYQDTLYAHSGRQFYRECDIYGTVDFIFGDATAVFQNCRIFGRKSPHNIVTLTAQNRSDQKGTTGFIIHNSNITSSDNLEGVWGSLGRPWGPYARTVVMGCTIDSFINPMGWSRWDANADVNNVYYAEYNNYGPGSSTTKRVNWKGHHIIDNAEEASQYTVGKFLQSDTWLPFTNVPYTSGL